MGTDMWEKLKQQFGYDEWADRSSLRDSLLIWRFFISPPLLAGWLVSRSQRFVSGSATRTELVCSRPTAGEDELLRLDIFECSSLRDAHEQLLQTLGEFQSAAIRQMAAGVGDIQFGNGEFTQLFARANLVVMLRNAGKQLVPVAETARAIDGALTSRPEASRDQVAPTLTRFLIEEQEAKAGSRVTIGLEATDPLGRAVWFKLFASGGQLTVDAEQLIYQPEAAGTYQITAFALNENQGVATRTVSVRVT